MQETTASPLAADGSLLLCTPVDPLFMVLPYLTKAGKVCTCTCSNIPQFNTIMDSCTTAWLEVCFRSYDMRTISNKQIN